VSGGFIRPELARAARRWREALAGAGLAVLGLWWALASRGAIQWLALLVVAAGAAVAAAGLQRARFRTAGDGPGVVQVTEAQIAYFGPLEGGVVAIDQLQAITLDPTGRPLHWRLSTDDSEMFVPVTARGAEALLDAFAQLPGFRVAAALRTIEAPGAAPQTVWRRAGGRRLPAPG